MVVSLTAPRQLLSSAPFLALLGAGLFLTGCTDPTADLGKPFAVKGKVTMDSKPAAGVKVTFFLPGNAEGAKAAPAEFRSPATKTSDSGEYSLPTVYPGLYKVMIQEDKPADTVGAAPSAFETGPYAKYGDLSELKADVKEGSTEFNFDLTSK